MGNSKLVFFGYLLIFLVNFTQSAKILGVFPIPAKSHYILASALMRGLAEKGHDVTVINPFGEKDVPKNGTYKDILLTGDAGSTSLPDLFSVEKMNFVSYGLFLNFFGNFITNNTLGHPNVKKLLKSNESFDVVIVEQFVNDALKVFSYHYKAPLVLFITFGSNAWINTIVANPAPPSYVAEQAIDLNPSNFLHRVKNNLIYMFGELNRHFLLYPAQNKMLKQHFPDAPGIEALLYNASLVLVNSHISTNKAVPRVPSMIDIGGFHVKPPKKLPKDLQEYLDSAKEGVIYFSMGSALQSVNLPVEKRDIFLKVFSRLKQRVLWKWEEDVLPGQPPNVKLGKWLPQQDILAHPNIKAFITHGGLLSFIETVYHGVPVLAIPVFADQIINAKEAAAAECGRYIVYADLNEQNLEEAINDVLNSERYRRNVKTRSTIMHDRQHSPMDDADYWINYVIRHRGATHLRVAGLGLTWYQYLSLDVYAFLIGTFSLGVYLLYKFVKLLLCLLKSKPKIKSN